MRVLIGDECGLLKEIVPELSRLARPADDTTKGQLPRTHIAPEAHAGCVGVWRICNNNNNNNNNSNGGGGRGVVEGGVGGGDYYDDDDDEYDDIQTRARGVVDMAFLPRSVGRSSSSDDSSEEEESDNDDDNERNDKRSKRGKKDEGGGRGGEEGKDGKKRGEKNAFSFAVLRVDGSVESWTCVRNGKSSSSFSSSSSSTCSNFDGDAGLYRRTGVVRNIFVDGNDKSTMGRPVALATSLGRSLSWAGGRAHAGGMDERKEMKEGSSKSYVAAVDSLGNLSLLDALNVGRGGVVARYEAFGSNPGRGLKAEVKEGGGGTKGHPVTIALTKGQFVNRDVASALAVDASGRRAAVGGRERETVVLDLETGKGIWKAKNLRPNMQTLLQHPIWTTALSFLSPSTPAIGGSSDLLAVGTAFGQLRIYDVRACAPNRRPMLRTPDGLICHRVTAVCQLDDVVPTVAAADAAGFVHSIDLRRLDLLDSSALSRRGGKRGGVGGSALSGHGSGGGMVERRFVGPAGSVRALTRHPSLPVLAVAGLDRMLRTYDVRSRKMMDCVYLRQRINCALFCDDGAWVPEDAGGAKEGKVGGVGVAEYDGEGGGDVEALDVVEDYVDSSEDDADDTAREEASDEEEENDNDDDEEEEEVIGEGGSNSFDDENDNNSDEDGSTSGSSVAGNDDFPEQGDESSDEEDELDHRGDDEAIFGGKNRRRMTKNGAEKSPKKKRMK